MPLRHRPFHHEDIHILLRQVIEDEPVRPSRHVPGSPRDLELIARKCLAKDPADRYPSARDLAADLAHFLAGEPIQASAGRIPDRVAKWIRRKPTLAAAYALTAAVLILLMFGSSLAVLWRNAERARATAVIARQNAEMAEQNAEIARRGEARARSDVEVARENLAVVEYGRTMQVAYQEWRDNNAIGSLALLDSTRTDLRGWEWKHVNRLLHEELRSLKGHTDIVRSVCWSPDGTRIATASLDGTARIWDARIGAEILQLKGDTSPVMSVCWSPDGKRIATANQDHTARIWDARTGAEALTLKGRLHSFSSVCWSPDGERIATAAADHTGGSGRPAPGPKPSRSRGTPQP